MRILMVATDISFPDFSGGSRRTLETARILKEFGHEVCIVSNRSKHQQRFQIFKGFKVYRKRMADFGSKIRTLLNTFHSPVSRNHSSNNPAKKYGFDSYLVLDNKSFLKELYRHQFPVHKLLKTMPLLPSLIKIIRNEKIDVVYERGPSYGIGILAAKITDRPSIIDFIDILYWNWSLKHCDRILAYFTKKPVPDFISRQKIDLVYTCVDPERFSPKIKSENVRATYNIHKDVFLGIYVGGFYSWHGLDMLVDSIALLKEDEINFDREVKIILVGEGEMYNHIKQRINEEGLQRYFIITGRIDFDQVPAYIKSVDFCLSLNNGDAIGLKLFEYLSMAKPVIATNVDLMPKFFTDGKDIVLIESDNTKEVIDSIKMLMDNPQKRETIGNNGRDLVLSRYTWSSHGKNILNSILNSIKHKLGDIN